MENLHYFLTNILNLILFEGYYYCSCEKFGEKKVDSCSFKSLSDEIGTIFVEILDTDKQAIDCFLNGDHVYSGQGRKGGEKW